MNLGDDKAIKTSQWFSNMIMRSDDINQINAHTYQNITDQLALRASQDSVDEVLHGLILEPDTLLTCKLKAGAAISFSGAYMVDGAWGFAAGAGDIFSVIVPTDTAVPITAADPTNPRIDILEIRPVQTPYNPKSRQFKDPVTEIITSDPTNTRLEYGFEAQVLPGTPGVTPSAPAATAGWIKLAEINVPATATSITAKDILTFEVAPAWNAGVGDTISVPEPLTAGKILSIYNGDSLTLIQAKIDSMPRDLGKQTLSIEFEAGTALSTGFVNIQGFYNGNLSVLGSCVTTACYINMDDIKATVSYDLDITVSGAANYSLYIKKCYFVYILSIVVAQSTYAQTYGIRVDESHVLFGSCSVTMGATGSFNTGYGFFRSKIDGPYSITITGGTLTDGILAWDSTLAELPTISGAGTVTNGANLLRTTVLNSDNSTTVNSASSKYIFLDNINTQIQSSTAGRFISAKEIIEFDTNNDQPRAACYDPVAEKYVVSSRNRDLVFASDNGLDSWTSYSKPSGITVPTGLLYSPTLDMWVLSADRTQTYTTDDYTLGAAGWTAENFSFTSGAIYGLADNGTIVVVAGGDGTTVSQLSTSTDNITWTLRTVPNGAVHFDVEWCGGTINKFVVASHSNGRMAYSSDGITWTDSGIVFSGGGARRIAYDPVTDTAVAVALNGQIAYTTNGTSWTLCGSNSTTPFGATTLIHGVVPLRAGGFMAWANGGITCRSDDGRVWYKLMESIAIGFTSVFKDTCIPTNPLLPVKSYSTSHNALEFIR